MSADTPAPRQSFWDSSRSENETRGPLADHVANEETPPPAPELTTESPVQQPAAPAEDESQDQTPQDQTPSESTGLDLSTPESTTRSFAKALISGDAESILACWSPDAEDYADMKRTFYDGLTDGEQRAHNKAMQVFQALDPDAMPIVAKDEIDGGIMVRVQATFKEDVTVEGLTFRAGDTFDFPGVTLRPFGENWLIYNIDG